jgi:hypothetical protein
MEPQWTSVRSPVEQTPSQKLNTGPNGKSQAKGVRMVFRIVMLIALGALAGGGTAATGQAAKNFKWMQIASMAQARLGHGLLELPLGQNGLGLSNGGGKVIAIGGFDSSPLVSSVPANPLASCEIYDPQSNTWVPASPHPVAAGYRWVARLTNGMILVAGGLRDRFTPIPDSHLYDPRTNQWIATKPLPTGMMNPHGFMRAILLPSGQVLIAGGEDLESMQNYQSTGVLLHTRKAFLFTMNDRHPALSSWDYTRMSGNGAVSLMPEERTTSALVLTKSQIVLNVGGLGPPVNGAEAATNTASIYDPATGSWSKAAPMPPVYGLQEDELVSSYPTALGSRWAPFSQALPDGRVLIAGGMGGLFFEAPRASVILYSPSRNQWDPSVPMHSRRFFGSWEGALGTSGDFFAAGTGLDMHDNLQDLTGESLDLVHNKWSQAPRGGGPPSDGSTDSFEGASVVLSNGALQVAGGEDFDTESVAINTSWIFSQ